MPSTELPRVSIIMGVFNAERTLREAIESIKIQDYAAWEFVICDDGSTDKTGEILSELASHDSRLKIITFRNNRGLAAALNACISQARGTYLIRQDADDRSAPGRLRRLVAEMDNNPAFDVIGTWAECFDDNGITGMLRPAALPEARELVDGTVFVHPTCIMRTSAIRDIGCYDDTDLSLRNEDYDLWFRLYASGRKGMNIQEPFYHYRDDAEAFKRRGIKSRYREAKVRWRGYSLINVPYILRLKALVPLFKLLVPYVFYAWYRKRKLATKHV